MARVLLAALFGLLVLPVSSAFAADLLGIVDSATPEQVQQAIRNGADPNAQDSAGRTVLMIAAAFNPDPAVVSVLVRAGALVNKRGPREWTALMMAAYHNPNPAVITALLKSGASVRMRSEAGRTAFDYAIDNPKVKESAAYSELKP